jgi:hypothetical protein
MAQESSKAKEAEIEHRRDEALKRALGMPHKPHKPPAAKRTEKPGKES